MTCQNKRMRPPNFCLDFPNNDSMLLDRTWGYIEKSHISPVDAQFQGTQRLRPETMVYGNGILLPRGSVSSPQPLIPNYPYEIVMMRTHPMYLGKIR